MDFPTGLTQASRFPVSTGCAPSARSRTDLRVDSTWWDWHRTGWFTSPTRAKRAEPEFLERVELGIGADLGIGPCRVVQIVALDWDGDGFTDLLVGVDDLNNYWPDSDRLPQTQQVGFNQKGGHPGYDRGTLAGRSPQRPPVLAP